MPHVSGFLHVTEGGVGADNTLPSGGYPSHGLPNFPGMPDNSLPMPPPGIWPPPTPTVPVQPIQPSPGHPSAGLPTQPGHPDAGLPSSPGHPSAGLPSSPGHPGNQLPPGMIWPPVQGGQGKYLCLVIIPTIGWRFIVIDTSLKPSNELPSGGYPSGQPVPPTVDNELPPTPPPAQPKK